ncbi:NUDIX domain-containing protein [Halorubellus sp. PRR65]|uniref:NUDIX domain-containing protein n=1 Tax=Halorubellus sp. PRR65 TaxID=3098148 RepID=UPI002B258B77|nr:NUDIX domain-containing protein [Halorubellus sp. PRR65]
MTDEETHVVTAFVRHDGYVLLCRRSEHVGTYTGRWGAVSGYAEGDPDAQVLVELEEEAGFETDAVDLVRAGSTVDVHDDDLGTHWVVHPYLFDVDDRDVTVSEEHDACEWVHATEMLRRECVPKLWSAYDRVAPSVRSVTADDEHGAATLSVRALEVLRDRAGVLRAEDASPDAAVDEVGDLARRLQRARPSMAVVENRVNRAMATADADAASLETAAMDGINRAVRVDVDAAGRAASLVGDRSVLTLSRSGTVLRALQDANPTEVFVAESRPGNEGVDVVERLLADAPTTLHTDAAIGHVLATEDVDCVLVGADAVLADGRVVNKTGTRLAAVAAAHEEVPFFVACATDKVRADDTVNLETGRRSAVYDGDAPVDVTNPTFDVTPAHLVDAVVTERGELDPSDVREIADEFATLAAWREDVDGELDGGTGASGRADSDDGTGASGRADSDDGTGASGRADSDGGTGAGGRADNDDASGASRR